MSLCYLFNINYLPNVTWLLDYWQFIVWKSDKNDNSYHYIYMVVVLLESVTLNIGYLFRYVNRLLDVHMYWDSRVVLYRIILIFVFDVKSIAILLLIYSQITNFHVTIYRFKYNNIYCQFSFRETFIQF